MTTAKPAIILAFDDDCPTHLDFVIPELNRRRMVGTFYIVAGGERFQKNRARWDDAAQSPFVEFGNHTYTHRGCATLAELEPELQQANEVIYALKPGRPVPRLHAYARPGGVPWSVPEDDMEWALKKYHLVRRPVFFNPATPEKSVAEITAELLAAVDEVLESGIWRQIAFHGVGGDWLPTPAESFLALLDKLEAHRDELWVTDLATLHSRIGL